MRISITGSSGHVGRALYIRLRKYHDVIGLDRAPSSTADIVSDLENPAAIVRLLEGADALIHTAALHAPHVGHVSDTEFDRINVQATERLLDACLKQGVGRFIFTSTTALYGDAVTANTDRAAAWLDEAVTPRPRTIYHRTKLKAEGLVEAAATTGGLAAITLRMSRCFPEPADIMAVYRLHRGIDSRDVASAHQFAVEHATSGYQLFVVSGATPFQKSDCMALAEDAIDVLAIRAPQLLKLFKRRGWPLPASIDRVCVSNALIAKGWNPKYDFHEVLRQHDTESSEVLPLKLRSSGTSR